MDQEWYQEIEYIRIVYSCHFIVKKENQERILVKSFA